MFYHFEKMFAGHIKVLGGPHVARGPDVAQGWFKCDDWSKKLDRFDF